MADESISSKGPVPIARRKFLTNILIALGSFVGGTFIGGNVPGSTVLSGGGGGSSAPGFDFFRDAPVGVVVYYEGSLAAHPNLPNGASPKWNVIATDRVLVGATVDADIGTQGGAESLTAEGAHAVTQPNTHAAAGGHQHDAHGTAPVVGALIGTVLTSPVTHAVDGSHAHDAHSGTAVATHAIKTWRKAYVLKKVAT